LQEAAAVLRYLSFGNTSNNSVHRTSFTGGFAAGAIHPRPEGRGFPRELGKFAAGPVYKGDEMVSNDIDQSKSRLFDLRNNFEEIADEVEAGSRIRQIRAGTVLDGKFEVLGLLGTGGMGAVYRVRHQLLNRDFALKLLNKAVSVGDSFPRFQREAQVLAKIQSENVIQVFDFGIFEDNAPYYTMDCLNGESLEEHIARNGALSTEAVVSIFSPVAKALYQAHQKGIVHRDLKPANLFLHNHEETVVVKVLDFGIARLTETLDDHMRTTVGIVFGSPLYMSPEQSRGQAVDERSDIYSLGCTIFQALTTKPPFRGDTVMETINMHREATPPSLQEPGGMNAFDPQLADLVQAMMAKEPEDRPDSMLEVALELDKLLNETTSTETGDTESPNVLLNVIRSKPVLLSAGAVIVLIMAALCMAPHPVPSHYAPRPTTVENKNHDAVDSPSKNLKRGTAERMANGQMCYSISVPSEMRIGSFSKGSKPEESAKNGFYSWTDSDDMTFYPSVEFLQRPSNLSVFPDNSLFGIGIKMLPTDPPFRTIMRQLSAHQSQLQNLIVGDGKVAPDDIDLIEQLAELEVLVLNEVDVDCRRVAKLKRLSKLRILSVSGGHAFSDLLPQLKACKQLYSLNCSFIKLTDAELATIASLDSVTELYLGSTGLTDKRLEIICKKRNLRKLNLSGNPITNKSMPAFLKMVDDGLLGLTLEQKGWSQADLGVLRKRLQFFHPLSPDLLDFARPDDMKEFIVPDPEL